MRMRTPFVRYSRFRIAALLLVQWAIVPLPGQQGWLQTARVFLIDAYQPPFEEHLEYDPKVLAATMARMGANTVRIATMGRHALIPGIRFTPHPDLGGRDILAETIAACKPLGIKVVPYISTGHRLSWEMLTRDYPEYAQAVRPGGGPARSHMYAGGDYGTVCWNGSYRKAYLDYLEKVVRDYDIDGVYFDTWRPAYFWPGKQVCYCDACRRGFRERTGQDLPWHESAADYTADDNSRIDAYHAWQAETLREVALAARSLVKKHRDVPLIYNINNPDKMSGEDPAILKAMDAFLYERGRSMVERAEGVSLARASGLGVWPYIGSYDNWPRIVNNAIDFQQQIFITMMFGGAPIIAQPYPYLDQLASRPFIETPFKILREHEQSFAGFQNVPYVAVLYTSRNPKSYAQSGWWLKSDVRSASLGAFTAALREHIQVTSIHESILDRPADLQKYQVLYLPSATYLSPSRVLNLRNYVSSGGGLIASQGTSLYTQTGERQDRFALEDLIRVAPLKPDEALAAKLASHQAMMGGAYDLYYADRGNAQLSRLTPLWAFEPVRVLPGGEVWKDIVTGDNLAPILPGVVLSSFGKGKVAYSASSIESLYNQNNDHMLAECIRGLIAKVAPSAPPYAVRAPGGVFVNLTQRGDARVLHLTNWTGDRLEQVRTNEYYVGPVENIRIQLKTEGQRILSVKALNSTPFRQVRTPGGGVEINLPRLEAYQGFRIELEPWSKK